MDPVLSLLRPFSIRQGERSLGRLERLPLPDDQPHGLVQPRDGVAGGRRLAVAVLGDELALGAGLASADDGLAAVLGRELADREHREVLWHVVGHYGADVEDLHHQLVPQLGHSTEVAVLVVGHNDMLGRTSVKTWREELAASLDLLQDVPRVAVVGCPPLDESPLVKWPLSSSLRGEAAAFNRTSRELCRERGREFVPFGAVVDHAADQLHPGIASQQDLALRLAEAIAED